MKSFLFAALCLALAARATTAQVSDGSQWTDGAGTTATAQVTDGATASGDTVTVVDQTGFTDPLPATMAPGSTADKPKAQSSTSGTTNSNPGNSYRVKNGKLQKKNAAGKWIDMRRVTKRKTIPKPPAKAEAGGGIQVGEEGTSIPGGAPPKAL